MPRITVTEDAQEVDTHLLGFTVSPHEECAVEEAVRIIEAQGGSVSVLTLGPPEAVEQLRDAAAIGAGRLILLETDGREWGPLATTDAIVEAVRAHEAEDGTYDLILFGNEAADTGDYQIPIRVAHALGRPCATGIKHLGGGRSDDWGTARVPRWNRALRARPARSGLCQRGDQPPALPLPARAHAGQEGRHRTDLSGVARGPRQKEGAPGTRSWSASVPKSSALVSRRYRRSSGCSNSSVCSHDRALSRRARR